MDGTEKAKITTGVDEPLANPADDCLDRESFAKRIFTLIDNTPIDTHLRVGILGDWGSGKTSTMNFIKYYCQEKKHPIAVFHPWQFHSREDAWKGFVSSVDKGLAAWNGSLVGNFKRKRTIKDISGKARQLAEIAGTGIGKTIANLILAPLENLLEETKASVTKDLKKILKDKRLYVFIDDLDRAEPEIVYDILMLLNEIIDIGQCIYIIGLDTKTVANVLNSKLGYTNPKEFLDKIINWPFELPIPMESDWNTFLENELKYICTSVEKDAITSIMTIVPKNPRKFKHYLRYLNSLHKGFLHRFGPKELDWKMLYVAQLLRLEFPEIFRKIMQDSTLIEDIATGQLMDKFREKDANDLKKKQEIPEWQQRIELLISTDKNINKERFYEIYKLLRESAGLTSSERVKNHLLVLEVPELMTWSEYYEQKRKILSQSKDKDILNSLKKFVLENQKIKDVDKVREFIRMLLRDHEQIWNQLVELRAEKEITEQLLESNKVLHICDLLLDIDELFLAQKPIFDLSTFEEWFEHLSKWAHFTRPQRLYKKPREEEKRLLLKMISRNLFRVSKISEVLYGKINAPDFFERGKAFENTRKEIKNILEKALTDDLLNRFSMPDGIHGLWPQYSFAMEKQLLFKDGTLFHRDGIYKRLREISKKAKFDVEVQKNCFEMLQMLCHGAVEVGGWSRPEDVKQLLKKKKFFSIIWNGAVCKPLNRRFVGSIEADIQKLDPEFNECFNRPRWWNALVAEGENKPNKHE